MVLYLEARKYCFSIHNDDLIPTDAKCKITDENFEIKIYNKQHRFGYMLRKYLIHFLSCNAIYYIPIIL